MDFEIRPIVEDEFANWTQAVALGFGDHTRESDVELVRPWYQLDRTVAAFDNGKPVSGAHSLSCEMGVPGGSIAVAAVGPVAVQPTHRRKGILTSMMANLLKDVHERGEPVAVLRAAESIIYGRFGYGIGTVHENWSIERPHTAYAGPFEAEGRTAFVTSQEMRQVFPEVHRRATQGRPGAVQPPAGLWGMVAADLEHQREGASANFHVVYRRGGDTDGYVTYRLKDEAVRVSALLSVTDEAHAALWRYCFDVDLRSSTTAIDRPVDDPLPWMLADPRRLKKTSYDGLWLRLVDLRAALLSRRYARQGRLVLDVRDGFCPWNEGRYLLEGGPSGAECRPTGETPDLVLSTADVAACYLGAARFTTLARAGRVEERTRGALSEADAMFATDVAAWSPYEF